MIMSGKGLLLDLEDHSLTSLSWSPPSVEGSGAPGIKFSPDGQRIAAFVIGVGGKISVIGIPDGRVMGEIESDVGASVVGLDITSEGNLAIADLSLLQVLSLSDGKILQTIRHNASLNLALSEQGVYWSPGICGNYRFAPYDESQQGYLWRVSCPSPYGSRVGMSRGSRGDIFAVSRRGEFLAAETVIHPPGQEDTIVSQVALYRTGERKPFCQQVLPGTLNNTLLFSMDNSFLIGDYERTVFVILTPGPAAFGKSEVQERGIVLLSTADCSIIIKQTPVEAAITGLALSSDGQMVAMTTDTDQAYIWDRRVDTLYPISTASTSSVPCFSPDGSLLALQAKEGLQLWDVHSRQLLHTLDVHNITALVFSPDQRILIAGDRLGSIYIWGVP